MNKKEVSEVMEYVWLALTILGTIGIFISVGVHIVNLDVELLGLWGFIFQISLGGVVLMFGFDVSERFIKNKKSGGEEK